MTATEMIRLVRQHGIERYRCGKAHVRARADGANETVKREQLEKATMHARKSHALFKKLVVAIDPINPYMPDET